MVGRRPAILTQTRRRLDQTRGVWMQGLVEDLRRRCALDDPAQVHHGDLVARVACQTEIVRDKQHHTIRRLFEQRDNRMLFLRE